MWRVAMVAASLIVTSCSREGGRVRARDTASAGSRETLSTALDVRIQVTDSVELAGRFVQPRRADENARVPALLLLSGSGPQDRDGSRRELPGYTPFRDIADAMVARGVAVLRFDDRGTGESSGRFDGATTYDFARDAEAALRWLRVQPAVDARRIVLVGHSEGALVALVVASRDSTVSSVVLMAAAARDGRSLARWQRQAFVTSDAAEFPPSSRGGVLATADAEADRAAAVDPWLRTWFAIDPMRVARSVEASVLLLHGETDQQVPVGDAAMLATQLQRRARRTGQPRDVVVRRFPATDHLFLEDRDGDPRGYVRLEQRHLRDDVLRAIGDWALRP